MNDLVQMVCEISCTKDFQILFSKGHHNQGRRRLLKSVSAMKHSFTSAEGTSE